MSVKQRTKHLIIKQSHLAFIQQDRAATTPAVRQPTT
jgi:hypothetical protein